MRGGVYKGGKVRKTRMRRKGGGGGGGGGKVRKEGEEEGR